MSGFEQALRLARRASFEEVTVGEWARAVNRCHWSLHRSGQVDGVIQHAALVARIAAPDAAAGSPRGLATAFGVVTMQPFTAEEISDARTAVGIVTHTAKRSATGRELVLLGLVERDLLAPRDQQGSFERALRGWRDAALAAGSQWNPGHISIIAARQAAMLRATEGLLDRVELAQVPAGEFLAERLEVSRRAWQSLAREAGLAALAEPHPGRTPAIDRLSVAADAIQQHWKDQGASPGEQLTALLRTGIGGNLAVAVSIGEGRDAGLGEVIEAAHRLEVVSELSAQAPASAFRGRPVELTPDRLVSAGSVLPAAAVEGAPSISMGSTGAVDGGPRVGVVLETWEAQSEGARRRDVGILAQAALEGNPEATRLTRHIQSSELERLVEVGQQATADLLTSSLRLVDWALRGKTFTREGGEEMRSRVLVRLVERIGEWDPRRGKLSTFVHHVSRSAVAAGVQQLRREKGRSYSMFEWAERGLGEHFEAQRLKTPEVQAQPGFDEHVTDQVAKHQMMRQLGRLAAEDRQLLAEAFGLDGPPATQKRIAEQRGISPPTAKRRVDQALRRASKVLETGTAPSAAARHARHLDHYNQHKGRGGITR